jgi:hypothetical protein
MRNLLRLGNNPTLFKIFKVSPGPQYFKFRITFVNTCGIKSGLYVIADKFLTIKKPLRSQTEAFQAIKEEVPKTILN